MVVRLVITLLTVGAFLIIERPTSSSWTCQCVNPTLCQAYTISDSVFVGKIVRSTHEHTPPGYTRTEFEVVEGLKGNLQKYEEIVIPTGCGSPNLNTGETYVVYKYKPELESRLCVRIQRLLYAKQDLEYARSIRSKPSSSIQGRIDVPEASILKKFTLVVANDRLTKTLSIDDNGFFSLGGLEPGKYLVKVQLPFRADILTDNLGNQHIGESQTYEYIVQLEERACDFREIQIRKSNGADLARLTGLVTASVSRRHDAGIRRPADDPSVNAVISKDIEH